MSRCSLFYLPGISHRVIVVLVYVTASTSSPQVPQVHDRCLVTIQDLVQLILDNSPDCEPNTNQFDLVLSKGAIDLSIGFEHGH